MPDVRFLSWNLAMLERSAEAPFSWEQFHAESAVRDLVLAVEPDVVCWQELPGLVPFVETLNLLPATTVSHSGNLATLATHERIAAEPAPTVSAVGGAALLTTFGQPPNHIGDGPGAVTVANVHFEPGPAGADRRLAQLAAVVEASPTQRLLIVGDTNMRVDEAGVLFDAGFTGELPPHPTWDSHHNRFRDDGDGFHAYFTRWFASPGLEVRDVRVHRDPVEHDERRFYLSDHYALSGEVRITA